MFGTIPHAHLGSLTIEFGYVKPENRGCPFRIWAPRGYRELLVSCAMTSTLPADSTMSFICFLLLSVRSRIFVGELSDRSTYRTQNCCALIEDLQNCLLTTFPTTNHPGSEFAGCYAEFICLILQETIELWNLLLQLSKAHESAISSSSRTCTFGKISRPLAKEHADWNKLFVKIRGS